MPETALITSIFLIFLGAALMATVALMFRQSLLVAYMLLGVVLGPSGLHWMNDLDVIKKIGEVGIIFLLFLLGLQLPPQKLLHMLKKVSIVAAVSSIVFLALGYVIARFFSFTPVESVIIGAAMMFSSTIIGIKLLPTTVLHHQHTGEVMISVLLLQDLLAIAVLLTINGVVSAHGPINNILFEGIGFPALLVFAFGFEYVVLRSLLARFNRIKEYLFLVAIAWCLAMAQLASNLGLTLEIGAFIAGVSLATSPISFFIAESLKPVRDFFLVMFFFSIGAIFDLDYLGAVIVPAMVLTLAFMLVKPVVYSALLQRVHETKEVAWEVGVRLAQISEFSLIIAFVSLQSQLIGNTAAYLVQAATLLTFVVSSYWVVLRYPTPVAISDRMRRD